MDQSPHPILSPIGAPPLVAELDRLRLLLEINNAIVSTLDPQDLLHNISLCLRCVIAHDFAGIALYDANSHQLRVHVLDFPQHQDLFASGVPIPIDGSAPGRAFTSRQPVLVRSIEPGKIATDDPTRRDFPPNSPDNWSQAASAPASARRSSSTAASSA